MDKKDAQMWLITAGVLVGGFWLLHRAGLWKTSKQKEQERLMEIYLAERQAMGLDVAPGEMAPQVYFPPFNVWLMERQKGLRGAAHTGMMYESPIEGPMWMY